MQSNRSFYQEVCQIELIVRPVDGTSADRGLCHRGPDFCQFGCRDRFRRRRGSWQKSHCQSIHSRNGTRVNPGKHNRGVSRDQLHCSLSGRLDCALYRGQGARRRGRAAETGTICIVLGEAKCKLAGAFNDVDSRARGTMGNPSCF